ncbi:MAG: DUF456 domain-containing protein [Firmicutes bacterium HGW-Firmicutes-15]|nr:MAG: DUF456 domain-containing protein [Firmicutes bacterium HGW-Firmicutes-15]
MDVWVVIITLAVILLGIAGTFVPVLPGVPLVFIAIAAYGWHDGFQTVTPRYLAIIAGVTVLSLFVDYLSTYLGAKYFGSSKKGLYGAVIGSFVGLFIFPPAGLLIGPWVGAIIGEFIDGNDWNKALRSGMGAVIGLFSGIAFKLMLATLMLVSFLIIIF